MVVSCSYSKMITRNHLIFISLIAVSTLVFIRELKQVELNVKESDHTEANKVSRPSIHYRVADNPEPYAVIEPPQSDSYLDEVNRYLVDLISQRKAVLQQNRTHSASQTFSVFWEFVYNRTYKCNDVVEIGGKEDGDGGYPLCSDAKLWVPSTSRRCLVYSFGVGDDFSFDEGMARRGCEVHSFDPSINVKDGLVLDSGVKFHKIGIAALDVESDKNGWKMRTLQTLRQELNHSKQCIDYLKVDTDDPDVGGYEDQVMQEMLSTDLHKHVRQFSMEIHLIGPLVEVVRVLRVFRINRLLQRLYDKGYRLYDITDNVRGQRVARGNPELTQSDLVDEIMSTRIAMFWEVSFVNFNVEGCE